MSKHTPGPWDIIREEQPNDYPLVWVGRKDRRGREGNDYRNSISLVPRHVCQVYDQLSEEDAANARLVAAAPDLLGACKAIWNDWGDSLNATDPEAEGYATLQLVKAAIAKAEGTP